MEKSTGNDGFHHFFYPSTIPLYALKQKRWNDWVQLFTEQSPVMIQLSLETIDQQSLQQIKQVSVGHEHILSISTFSSWPHDIPRIGILQLPFWNEHLQKHRCENHAELQSQLYQCHMITPGRTNFNGCNPWKLQCPVSRLSPPTPKFSNTRNLCSSERWRPMTQIEQPVIVARTLKR